MAAKKNVGGKAQARARKQKRIRVSARTAGSTGGATPRGEGMDQAKADAGKAESVAEAAKETETAATRQPGKSKSSKATQSSAEPSAAAEDQTPDPQDGGNGAAKTDAGVGANRLGLGAGADAGPQSGAQTGAQIGAQPGPGFNPQNMTAAQEQAAAQKVAIFGHAVWLMTQSPMHKHLFLTDMDWLVLPPISLGQFRIWRNKGMPLAFASWAYLNADAEARIKQNIKRLAPTDWKSGDSLWLIDLIAPFGGSDEIVKELREQVFKGQKVKSLQPAPGGGVAVVEW